MTDLNELCSRPGLTREFWEKRYPGSCAGAIWSYLSRLNRSTLGCKESDDDRLPVPLFLERQHKELTKFSCWEYIQASRKLPDHRRIRNIMRYVVLGFIVDICSL